MQTTTSEPTALPPQAESAPLPTPASRAAAAPRIEARSPLASTWLGRANVLLASLFLAVFLLVAIRRVRYPFALEWIEGGMLDEVRWLLAGHPLYVRPSIDFVSFIYNPLYPWVCAAAAKVLGASLATMRLVSLAASLGTLGLLYALVVDATRSRAAGIVGAGLYAATFKVTLEFMDVARVDALYVFLAVASVWALRKPTLKGRSAGAVLLVLCFLCKQSGLLVAAPLVLFVLRDAARGAGTRAERLRGLPFAVLVVAGIGLSAGWLGATSDGWYWYYAFELPSSHRLVPWMWTDFWTVDLMGSLACACLGALFVLLGLSKMPPRQRELWGAALAGACLSAWSGRLHDGGWANVLMPAFAILAPLFAMALHAGLRQARSAKPAVRAKLNAFVALVGLLQLAVLLYDPRQVVPSAHDEAAGWRVVSWLRSAPGDTFTPSDSYLAAMAGKRPHLHQMAVDDILRGPESETSRRLREEIRAAFHEHRWAMVVTDNDWFADDVLANYARGPDSINEADVFFPVTGVRYRPGWIYRPK